jgi:cell division septation protein DedD
MVKTSWVDRGLVAGILCGLVLGCAKAKEPPAPDVQKGSWEVRMESPLDTVQVTVGPEGETASTPATPTPILETPVVTESVGATTTKNGPATGGISTSPTAPAMPPGTQAFTPGWRVQIFASSSMVSAEALASRARRQFTEPIYVEYEPPLYKVRVGDFLTKEDARHMANRAKAENFDAWVVEDLVLRPAR